VLTLIPEVVFFIGLLITVLILTGVHSTVTAMNIRIVFLGTPDFSVPCLQAVLAAPEIQVLGVITQPDRPAGRGNKLQPPPVKVVAEAAGLTVFQPQSLKKDTVVLDWLRQQAPDFLVTIAFGQILNQAILELPQRGTVNVHASLLPRYRGANPIQQAIIDGQGETGLTTMLTDIGVDTGDMLLKTALAIGSDDTAVDLHDRLANAAGPLLIDTLTGLVSGTVIPQPQNHDAASHSPKAKKEDALLDWSCSAQVLHNRVRGQQPWPGAVTGFITPQSSEPQSLKIIETRLPQGCSIEKPLLSSATQRPGQVCCWEEGLLLVHTGEGILGIKTVQPAGKKPMPVGDWLNGLKLSDITQLQLNAPPVVIPVA